MANKKGFTLIELLVVVAIIALLLSILTPALNQVKERGRRAVCMSNIRQLGMANIMYAQMYGGRFVPVKIEETEIVLPNGTPYTPPWSMWCTHPIFLKLLDQNILENLGYNLDSDLSVSYFGLPKKFRCPSYPSNKASVAAAAAAGVEILQTSYGLNITDYELDPVGGGAMEEVIWITGPIVDQIKRPADKLLFTDAVYPFVTYASDQGNYVNHWDEHGEFLSWDDSEVYSNYLGDHGAEPIYRHSEGANVVFCDGHTEYLKKTEMFYFDDGNKPNLAADNVDVHKNNKLWSYFR
jgi:prepilin-type N-terminal cleavage/methylation domain-containing protein/prepilin-type processing-associated H-X9-DG protein